jgi:hypothetical protein
MGAGQRQERWRLDTSKFPPATSLTFSADSKKVVLSAYQTHHLWDLAQNQEVRRFGGNFRAQGDGAAFSRDGKFLAVLSHAGFHDPGILRFWDVDAGALAEPFDLKPYKITCFAFSPDGRTLATACSDTTILIWEIGQRPARGKESAPPRDLEPLWANLAADDAAKAFKAMTALESQAKDTSAFFKEKLRPIAPADAKQIQRLCADLGGNAFATRDKAKRELERLGDLALPALRELHKKPPSLETKRLLDDLIPKLEGPATSPDLLRELRAIEVLEQIGNAQARQVLETISHGADQHRTTIAARDALRRLKR